MKSRLLLFALLILAVIAAGFGLAMADSDNEAPAKLEQLPAAVVQALKKQAAGAEIIRAFIEKEMESTEYEIVVKLNGRFGAFSFNELGVLLSKEMMIPASELPAAVKAVFDKFAEAGEVDDFVREEEEGKVFYSAEVEIGKTEFELKLDSSGAVVEVESADDEDIDDDGDDDADDDDGDDDAEDLD